MSAVKTKGLSVLRRIGGFLVAAPGKNDAGKSRFERWWRPLFGYARFPDLGTAYADPLPGGLGG